MQWPEIVGWAATGLALVGVWLNNKQRRACFALWLVSNTMTLVIHAAAGMWSLATRDFAFFVLAIHGWWLWSTKFPARRADTAADSAVMPASSGQSAV